MDFKEEKIVYKDINELRPYENNPRINHGAVEHVVNSIKNYGFRNPIILDKENVIIAGHTRLKAAKELGIKMVPCIIADDLTEQQAKALRLLDNKTAEFAQWDFDLLRGELEGLELEELGIDWGIEVPEFDKEQEIIEDEVPEIPETPKAKYGDIYRLGNHRLMCGDSTKKEDIEKLMNGEKADLLFTDPPYNVSIESKSKQILNRDNYSHIENDDLPIEEFKKFLDEIFKNANLILNDDASYYVFACQGGDNELMMMMMMRKNDLKCRHQIIWVKDAPVFSMGRLDYDYKHEPILYGWKKRHNFYRKGEQDKSVWEYKRIENKLHPTMKPVELICNAILNSTKEKDNIIDLFGGSGSTLIACEQLNRKCYTMEIDPHYVDVIIERWENLTGQKAVKINE